MEPVFDFLLNFSEVFLGAIAGISLLRVLPQKWVDYVFERQIQSWKAALERQNTEHRISFTRLDAKVSEAIESAYELVCEYAEITAQLIEDAYMHDEADMKALYEQIETLAKKFNTLILRQSIYLPVEIAKQLKATRQSLRDEYVKELVSIREFKTKKENGESVSTVLSQIYTTASMRARNEVLLESLQCLAKEHLRRFPAH